MRLFGVPPFALREVSRSGRGLRPGERLVIAIDPNDVADRGQAELLSDFRAVIKNLRTAWSVKARPSDEALVVYRLKDRQGRSYRQIADQFTRVWRDCADVESRERRAKRYVKEVRAFLDVANKRSLAGLTKRQQAILETYERIKASERNG